MGESTPASRETTSPTAERGCQYPLFGQPTQCEPGTFQRSNKFYLETRFISGQCKECSHDQFIQLNQERTLPPFAPEMRTCNCRSRHLDDRYGGKSIRANETHPRSRQISGQS